MAGSGTWNKLYQRVEAPKAESGPSKDALYKAKLAGEAAKLLDKWCAKAAEDVTAALRAAATERAKAFEKVTGMKIVVRTSGADAALGLRKNTMPSSFTTLALDEAYVHLYITRAPGEFPLLHHAYDADALMPPSSVRGSVKPGSAALHRLVSTAACMIARGPDGRPRLREPGTGEDGPLVKLDDVLFKAFERLVDAFKAYGG